MKKITCLLAVLLLAAYSSAYQDANLLVDNRTSGLCLSVDGIGFPKCNGDYAALEGTADHTVYIMPESSLDEDSSAGDILTYVVSQPLLVLTGGVGLLTVAILFFLAVASLFAGFRRRVGL